MPLGDSEVTDCKIAVLKYSFHSWSGWKTDYGGYTTYLTSGEDEEVSIFRYPGNSARGKHYSFSNH